VLRMMEEVNSEDLVRLWSKKLAPPLVTLLSAEPEVQYVALRNINLIVQRWPQILSHEVKVSAHCQGLSHCVPLHLLCLPLG
jgi:AP-1 complex subunit beta-1